jgi:hypothetical protein
MKLKENKGAITVFLSIILLSIVIFVGVLVDGARMRTAEAQVKRAVHTSAYSALAEYNNDLKESYGLFALSKNSPGELEEVIKGYLNKNLMTKESYTDKQGNNLAKGIALIKGENNEFIDLYDFKIENIEVTPIYNYTENEVTKQQILEYMKYRAPKELVENFLVKLNAIKDAQKEAEICEEKVDVEEEIHRIGKRLIELEKDITIANGFNSNEYKYDGSEGKEKQESLTYYCHLLSEYRYLCKYKNNLEQDIKELNDSQAEDDKSEEIKAKKETLKRVEKLINSTDKARLKRQSKIRGDLYKYIEAIKDAIKNIDGILEKSKVIEEKIKELESLNNSLGEGNKLKDSVKTDIENYRKIMPKKERLEEIKATLTSNLSKISSISQRFEGDYKLLTQKSSLKAKGIELNVNTNMYGLDEDTLNDYFKPDNKDLSGKEPEWNFIEHFNRILGDSVDYKSELEAITETLAYFNDSNYKTVSYSIEEKGDKTKIKANENERNQKKEETKSEVTKKLDDINQLIKNAFERIPLKELPSYKAGGKMPNKILTDTEALLEEDKGIKDLDGEQLNNIDLGDPKENNESKSFIENAFGFLAQCGKFLENTGVDLRDNIYLNEYIMLQLDDYTEYKKHVDEGNVEKGKHLEVEYILNGQDNDVKNFTLTSSKILLLRFVPNFIDYLAPTKGSLNTLKVSKQAINMEAEAIAQAICVECPPLAPVVKTLILAGYAMIDSANDVWTLLQYNKDTGKSVEVKFSDRTPDIKFSYQDYIRFLLLMEDTNKKLDRIEDMVQLNMQRASGNKEFKLSGCNTYIKVKAKVSMKYMFLSNSFMPKDIEDKYAGKRHEIEVVLYEGY